MLAAWCEHPFRAKRPLICTSFQFELVHRILTSLKNGPSTSASLVSVRLRTRCAFLPALILHMFAVAPAEAAPFNAVVAMLLQLLS